MKRVKITIDSYGLKSFNNNKEISFKSLFTEKAMYLRKNKEIGRSFQMDGCQAIIQYLDVVIITQTGSVEAARKRIPFDRKILTKMNQSRQEGEVKSRQKFQVLTVKKEEPSEKSFINETYRLFRQKRLDTRRRSLRQNLLKNNRNRPRKKPFGAQHYTIMTLEWMKIIKTKGKNTHTLTRKEYNEKIGAQRQRRWNGLRRRGK